MPKYATGDDLIKRFDVDLVGDLATDERETLDRDDVATHPNVVAAIEDAESDIDANLLVGGRYLPTDLTGLTGAAQNHLIRIVCTLAMEGLFLRRPEANEEKMVERLRENARRMIDQLQSGTNIFGLPEEVEAGKLDTVGPSAVDIRERNDITSRMEKFFPCTESRLPTDQ